MTQTSQRLRLLIVEDEVAMQKATTRALSSYCYLNEDIMTQISYEISTASSVDEANQLMGSSSFDLLLVDYRLTDGTGVEILEKISTLEMRPLPIMMTAYANYETAVTATKLGSFDFLPKPFTVAELKNVIQKASNHLVVTRRARELEATKQKIRFNFISILSHELKAPIGAIEGYLNLLLDTNRRFSDQDKVLMLSRSMERLLGMRKLIFDLLDLTRIESGEKVRKIGSVDFCSLTNDVLEILDHDAKKMGVTVKTDFKGPLQISGDQVEFQIIVTNLISNAIKYNKNGGEVFVTLVGSDEHIELEVSDSGIGIEKDDLGRLFNDFVRIKGAETAHIQGSGLGLSTVKKLVNLYGGSIDVKSEKGIGTSFKVILYKNSKRP